MLRRWIFPITFASGRAIPGRRMVWVSVRRPNCFFIPDDCPAATPMTHHSEKLRVGRAKGP